MTIITNPDANVQITHQDVKDFFLNTLGIDLTGKHLVIRYDGIGRIAEIDVDVVLTSPQTGQVEDEFYTMSINSIITALLTPASATAFLTDQGASSPTTIPISGADVLTDIDITADWNLGADASQFTLTDADTGEIQYTGTVPRTVMVSYSATLSVTNSFDHIYATLMRTPDGGSKTEIPGSRIYTETINGNDGQPISGSITILLQPLDKLKINVANNDNSTDLMVSVATMAVE